MTAPHSFSYPVRSHNWPNQSEAYVIDGTLIVPRWMHQLLKANYDHAKALELAAEHHVNEVDRRLKEKNL